MCPIHQGSKRSAGTLHLGVRVLVRTHVTNPCNDQGQTRLPIGRTDCSNDVTIKHAGVVLIRPIYISRDQSRIVKQKVAAWSPGTSLIKIKSSGCMWSLNNLRRIPSTYVFLHGKVQTIENRYYRTGNIVTLSYVIFIIPIGRGVLSRELHVSVRLVICIISIRFGKRGNVRGLTIGHKFNYV